MTINRQEGPYPHDLEAIVKRIQYRPGWRFSLVDIERDPPTTHRGKAGGLTFVITTKGYNSYRPERGDTYAVNHYFPVPAATYNYESWLRWAFDQLLKVETHECMEFFALSGPEKLTSSTFDRPFAPMHGPGDDPYAIVQYATDVKRRTSFRGEVKE